MKVRNVHYRNIVAQMRRVSVSNQLKSSLLHYSPAPTPAYRLLGREEIITSARVLGWNELTTS